MNNCHRAQLTPYSRELLVGRINGGWTPKAAAVAAGVSLRTAFKWLARYRAEGPPGLADRSRRPKRLARLKVNASIARRIEELRRQRLTCEAIGQQLGLSRATVARHLGRCGISRLRALDPPSPVKRYEREQPGELIHLDVKKLGVIGRAGHRVTGNRSERTRGAGWEYAHVIRFTRPYTPRTNGKAERFIQTSLREWAYVRAYANSLDRAHALPGWLAHYNYRRPHSALGGYPPISRINRVVNKVLRLDT